MPESGVGQSAVFEEADDRTSPVAVALVEFALTNFSEIGSAQERHNTALLERLSKRGQSRPAHLGQALCGFLTHAEVVHGQAVPLDYIVLAVVYALLYIAMLLVVAAFLFSRRDFK